MTLPTTETLPDRDPIDALPAFEAVRRMLDAQVAAVQAVQAAAPEIAAAALAMAQAMRNGGALVYVAAGSSGLMALADGCELSGTFGIPADRIRIHMAGGIPTDAAMPGNTEDDTAETDAITAALSPDDLVIALSASGTTPFPLAVALGARGRGVTVVAIACNQGSALLQAADIAICLPTPPEILAGSTRLGAGTAQKVALNAMSTQMGVHLGHVFAGRMVNVVADNAKLRQRAADMVATIADVTPEAARDALKRAGGHVKPAVLIAAGMTETAANAALNDSGGHLGPCLTKFNQRQDR